MRYLGLENVRKDTVRMILDAIESYCDEVG